MKQNLNFALAAAFMLGAGAITAAAPPTVVAQAADPYQALIKRDFGTGIDEMNAIDKQIQAASPDQYPDIESKLITVIESPDATAPGKQYALQKLRNVGSSKCIPAVAKLLTDDKLSHMARNVFLGMHDPAVDTSLRQALGQTQGIIRIGIINTIGDRRDTGSVRPLAGLLNNGDEPTGRAVLIALSKIGGTPVADALDRAKLSDTLKPDWAEAYLRCAATVADAGNAARSQKMLRSLLDGNYPDASRAGALVALARAEREQSVPLILKTMDSPDVMMQRAAVSAVIAVPGHAATTAFGQQLAVLPSEKKMALLAALASRGDAQGLTNSVNRLAADQDPAIRQSAVRALDHLGDVSSVPVLAAALKDPALTGDATQALNDIQGDGVVAALIQQAQGGDDQERTAILTLLGQRGEGSTLPLLRKSLTDTDPKIRMAAIKALGQLGNADDMRQLSQSILTEKDDTQREAIATALSSIGGRMPDTAARADSVLQVLPQADPATRVQLLGVLSSLGGDKALAAERTSLADTNTEVHTAALQGLSEWPDTAPMADLLNAAKTEKDKSNRVLALRGYIRMISTSNDRGNARVQDYQQAMAIAERPEEKRQALSGLADVHDIAALKAVEPSLDIEELKPEAYAAYEKIAESLAGRQPAVAKPALQRVADNAPNGGLRNRAKEALAKL